MSWHLIKNIRFCLKNPSLWSIVWHLSHPAFMPALYPPLSTENELNISLNTWNLTSLYHRTVCYVHTFHTKLEVFMIYRNIAVCRLHIQPLWGNSSSDMDTWYRHLANVLYSPFSYMWEFRETSSSLAAKLFTIFTSQSLTVPVCCLPLMCLYMTVWEHGREPQQRKVAESHKWSAQVLHYKQSVSQTRSHKPHWCYRLYLLTL